MAADRELAAARPLPRCTGHNCRPPHVITSRSDAFRDASRVRRRTRLIFKFNMPPPATSLRETVETTLPKIFDQAQSSIANHQKNCVALYKLHLTASELRQSSSSGNGEKLVGERFFEETICDMMSRVLLVKKGQQVADRIAKFLGAYIKVLVEKSVFLP